MLGLGTRIELIDWLCGALVCRIRIPLVLETDERESTGLFNEFNELLYNTLSILEAPSRFPTMRQCCRTRFFSLQRMALSSAVLAS